MMEWNVAELVENINTGIEYEYALYFCLLNDKNKALFKECIIDKHPKRCEIEAIVARTNVSDILLTLRDWGLSIIDCRLETQNDEIGPSDIVLVVEDKLSHERTEIGISVKYQNSCTLNVTGASFMRKEDIANLKVLQKEYTGRFINEMTAQYGITENWFRKRLPSSITEEFIDLIRDKVIENWGWVENKEALVEKMFQMNSPIRYWVYEYKASGKYVLYLNPPCVDMNKVHQITVSKYQTSYIAFYLDGRMLRKMQVKFNNGFVEKCKKKIPDFVSDNIPMALGSPFSSWNFSVIYD